jgi:hypothetical protein
MEYLFSYYSHDYTNYSEKRHNPKLIAAERGLQKIAAGTEPLQTPLKLKVYLSFYPFNLIEKSESFNRTFLSPSAILLMIAPPGLISKTFTLIFAAEFTLSIPKKIYLLQ